MTATDELRRLLDERGVEYKVSVENGTGFEHVTWHPNKFSQVTWNEEFGAGWLAGWQQGVTPEQAIDATLGRKTCHIVKTWSDSDYDEDWRYRCSECGCFIGVYERDPETGDAITADNYCPSCGRKVVVE